MKATKGIDVSVFQGAIDWEKVKASGVDFAIIKAGQGHSVSSSAYLFEDRYFKRNIEEAHRVGVKCGVYYYVTATTKEEATREARHFLSIIRPYKSKIDLWAVADVEDVSPAKYCGLVEKELLTDIVLEFCRVVKAGGFKPMLYSNRSYLKGKFDYTKLAQIPLWRAHWVINTPQPNDYPRDFSDNMQIWQWGADIIDGISGEVDANYGYFSDADLKGKPKIRSGITLARMLKKIRLSIK
jgi:GH25 family lysozyme M1 (1,4-beta-N-acetylmuramidase)